MKKLIIILTIVFIVFAGAFLSLSIICSPARIAAQVLTDAFDDVGQRKEINPLYKILQGGSIQVHFDGVRTEEYDCFENSYIHGKLYFSPSAWMLTDVDAVVFGNALSGEAYVSRDAVYVEEQQILGGAYGSQTANLAEELAASIFSADSNSNFSMDKTVYDKAVNTDSHLDIDFKTLSDSVLKDFWKIFLRHARLFSEKRTVMLDRVNTNVRVISIHIDAEARANLIKDIYEYLCASREIAAFVNEHNDTYVPVLDQTLGDAYDDLILALKKETEKINAAISGYKHLYAPITLELTTPKLSKKLLTFAVEVDGETVLSLDFGSRGVRDTDTVRLVCGEAECLYRVRKDDASAFSAELVVTPSSKDIFSMSLSINRTKGTYIASYNHTFAQYSGKSYENNYTVKGTVTTVEDTTTVTLNTLVCQEKVLNKYSGDTVSEKKETYTLLCEGVVDTADSMPLPLTEYSSIADITETQAETWGQRFIAFYEKFREHVMP